MTTAFKAERKRMRTATPATRQYSEATPARLQELRALAACKVLKSEGDIEEIRKDGVRVFEALENVRKRANHTCK